MSLKIVLKPGEKILLGNAVVANGRGRAELLLENRVPVLRQKDIITPDRARTACERLYVVIQLMYIDPQNARGYHGKYWDLARGIVNAAPSTLPYIERISQHILRDEHYQALRQARRLIRYEEELVRHAQE